jgi:hypothetical protein
MSAAAKWGRRDRAILRFARCYAGVAAKSMNPSGSAAIKLRIAAGNTILIERHFATVP